MAEGLPHKFGELDDRGTAYEFKWQVLPSLPLVHIYSFLSREDQYNMSRVCRNWSEGFCSPSLWKSFVFNMSEDKCLVDPWPLLEHVGKNCHVLKKVCIECYIDNMLTQTKKLWIKQFTAFMEILTSKSQLIFVEFQELGHLLDIDEPTNQTICQVIGDFLGSQCQLSVVRFIRCYFEHYDAVQILRKLLESSGHSLIYLYLSGFVENVSDVEEQEQIFPALAALPRLESLEVDYSLILGEKSNPSDVLETLKLFPERIFLKILLFICDATTDLKRLESSDWRNLRKVNANLRLEISIYTESSCEVLNEYFILPGIPITQLFYKFTKSDPFSKVAQFFNHLLSCETNKHLNYLMILIESPIPNLADALLPFLTACTKLKKLLLRTVYPANGLSALLESFGRNPPQSLQLFKLQISKIGNEEYKTMLEGISSKFVKGLKLEVDFVL